MRRIVAWILGIGLAANGLMMLGLPAAWYAAVPGVVATGPFNAHFIRDIGVAYLLCGAALLWFAISPAARPAALIGAAFLAIHAAVHLWDAAAGREHVHQLLVDLPSVFLSPVLAIWIVWLPLERGRSSSKEDSMIRWFLRRRIAAFERAWNYDASYMHDVLDADPQALIAFSKVAGVGRYRKDVPPAAYYAAAITGTMAEDCGPCTQLTIDTAARAGVDPTVLRALVARDFSAMPADAALAARFADASLRHAPEADGLRDEVVRRWGKRALVSLAFALTGARIFPTLKYALGHGRACTRVTVGGESRPVLRELTRAA